VRLRSLSLRRLSAAPLFIALLSVVILAGTQEASCEMHGLGAASAGAHAEGHAGAAMADHAETMAGAHESGDGEHGGGMPRCDCSCIGACSVSAPLAAPPTAVTLLIALVEPEPSGAISAEPALPLPRAPDRLLPFANGPPPSASV
jgi:hypothetical protein